MEEGSIALHRGLCEGVACTRTLGTRLAYLGCYTRLGLGRYRPQDTKADMMRALLVDDEQLAREELGFLLKSFPDVEVVGEASDGQAALREIDRAHPDIVFLDVQMPGLSGLEVARQLLARNGRLPYVVFATAFDHYAVEAFDVNAADYLLKPIERKRLETSIQRARQQMRSPERESERMERLLSGLRDHGSKPTRVLVRTGARLMLVDASEVILARVQNGAIRIVATHMDGYSNYKTLDELQSTLGDTNFWRPHRSYLVNINRIREVLPWFKSTYQLRMSDLDHTEVPVSRGQTKRLRKLFRL